MSIKGTGNLKNDLNRMNPAAGNIKLGDLLENIISNQNAILAKLDAIGAAATVGAINTAAGTTNVSTMALTLPSKL
jgi:hypothetical protein